MEGSLLETHGQNSLLDIPLDAFLMCKKRKTNLHSFKVVVVLVTNECTRINSEVCILQSIILMFTQNNIQITDASK